ncbi:beta-mannosidase [Christiangramia fulva]|uniref:Beta-mannosidase n=1 Tax=Christiangramia fulva TaxID=2126553 RepID=A0A2R3Z2W5_9FLAO|nr:glycosyl hydrolase [Christiangramia fulva]AVR44604.1 beta-mannosidase [Christiangramia fulva]
MKNRIFLLVFFMGLIMTSCSKDEIEEPTPKPPDTGNPDETPEEPEENPDEEATISFLPSETPSYMVDASATAETVALFYNLKAISYSNFIVGQQDAFSSFYNDNDGYSDIKKLTGSDPGMLGSDFMFITDDQNNGQPNNWFYQQEQMIKQNAIDAYNKGMVNIFCWHLREPYEGDNFYTSEMTEFQKQNAFKSILPGGANHEYYKKKLQKVAEFTKSLVGEDGKQIPIIFRPFHEFDKDFFWWGAAYSSPQEFIDVWRFTVEYLRDELGVDNMLYAFSPDNSYSTETTYLQRYPGDAYVDVVGMDNYGDLSPQDGSRIGIANKKLQVVSDLAEERVKIPAFTETGYFVTPSETYLAPDFYSDMLYKVLTDNDIKVGFMMFWQNSADTYTVPVPGTDGAEDFMDFIEKPEPWLLEDMSNIYDLPADE